MTDEELKKLNDRFNEAMKGATPKWTQEDVNEALKDFTKDDISALADYRKDTI